MTRQFPSTNKLKFLQRNLVEETEYYQNFNITYTLTRKFQFNAAFFSFTVHLVSQFGSTLLKECDEEYVLQNNANFFD